MTGAEHLAWCKERALAYVDAGDLEQAFSSMVSDVGKHPETVNPIANQLGMSLLMMGLLSTAHEMKKFIEGYN